MAQTQGVVTKVNMSASPVGSARKWTKKSFLINDEWYGAFVNADNKESLESVGEGDAVEANYETKGDYKNLVAIKLIAKHKDESYPYEAGNSRTYEGPPTHVPYNPAAKDFRITYLASRRDAIEFVKHSLQLGMVSVGKKKADEMDIFEELVHTYAMKFAMKSWEITPEVQNKMEKEKIERPTDRAVNE